jgi:glycosyltransferase involved in cell wall biosynthesis
MGFAHNRTAVIPNGFDCEQFRPLPHAPAILRKKLNLGEGAILIGLINRFHPMKDHATFLEGAGLISQMNPAVHFVLAGHGVDDENPILVDLAARFRLQGRIHLLGECDNIPELTAGLDIATSSSFSESFPNVIGEAMACGVPCVVTDVGHSAAIVGETGVIVPPRGPAALARGWAGLIAGGAVYRRQLGDAARQRIMDNFSLDGVVRQYETVYEEAVRATSLAN